MKIKTKTYFMDLETYSEAPIQCGAHAYAADKSARILLWAYALNDGPVKVWDVDQEPNMPDDLRAAIHDIQSYGARHVWVNGVMFDTVFLQYRGIDMPLLKCDDVRVIAYQHALPGGLGELCKIFKLPTDIAKDKDGSRLIQKFCAPKFKNGIKNYRMKREDAPADWERFVEYCRRDVSSMREIYKRFPGFNNTVQEKEFQLLDVTINRRGMCVDLDLVRAAIKLADKSKDEMDDAIAEKTGGAVSSVNQRQAILDHIKEVYGIELESLRSTDIERYLDDPEIPEPVKDILRDRLRGAKTSKAKYKVVENCNVGGRLKGCLQFRGASRTGRVSGVKFQPQNLPRPTKGAKEIEAAIELMKADALDLAYEHPSEFLSECLRGVIVASPGKRLCVADYSNVEGRVLAWLAGEEWKLQAFREFDAGRGHDLYKLTYGRTFGVDPEKVTKELRQIGKVEELALGYGGGAGAFAQFADKFGIDFTHMSELVRRTADPEAYSDSENMWDWAVEKKITAGLSHDVWVACNTIKQSWRNANAQIVAFWSACETAVRSAIEIPNKSFAIRPDLYAKRYANWLLLRLPSGRFLVYPSPRAPEGGDITYMGNNQQKRKFERLKTWGGKIVENITQAVACDLLFDAGLRLEKAGYEIVLSVHDEYICEIPDDKTRNHRHMEELMSSLPSWAEGLPLVAAGFESYRYRKD